MVHAFALELLWLFPSPEGGHGFPNFGHRYCPDWPPPAPKRLFGAYLSRSVTTPHLICTVHPADTQLHSPTTLAYECITHASITGSSHAIYGKADYAPTCAYRLLSFPIAILAHNTLLFLIAFLTYIPTLHHRLRVDAGVAVSTSHYFSSVSTAVHFRRATGPSNSPSTSSTRITPANRRATATPTQIKPTSTTANAATTMTPSGVAQPLS